MPYAERHLRGADHRGLGMWLRIITLSLLAPAWLIGPAVADTIQARCKVDRTVDLKVQPNKIDKRSESLRANAGMDWVFAYDLTLGRLCNVGTADICMMTSDDFAADPNGDLKGSTTDFSSGRRGNLILTPSSGRWIYQSDGVQTSGKASDCTFAPADTQQIALVSRDPTRDIDVLCAGRLNAEALILEAISKDPSGGAIYRADKLSEAQNVMGLANALLDRTNNRGYGRDASQLAALEEAQAYVKRAQSQRGEDISICEAHLSALKR
jgi:hypothetical protein